MPKLSSTPPKVACLLLWYPLFTQPFIFREVEGLKNLLPTTVYTLYGPNLKHCSQEMLEEAHTVTTHGCKALPSVLLSLVRHSFCSPKRFLTLARKILGYKWPTPEIFGENLWAFCLGLALAPKLKSQDIQAIYAPWPRGTTTAALVIKELTGIPFVTTVRGDNLAPADPDLLAKLQAATFIRTNNFADQERVQDLQKDAKAKLRLIYNGLTLPLEDVSPKIANYTKNRPLKILALGRFDVTKGFDVLILAASILKQQGRNISVTLAGGGGISMGLGKLEGNLKKLTHTLHLEDAISFPGLISHNDLPSLLKDHDIFAAPCVIDPQGRRDGIPNTVIEAMSYGLPVVASNINALPEVVIDHKTGLTVPAGDPKALACAIAWLADHPMDAAHMGEAGKAHATRLFDPKTNAKHLADLLIACAKHQSPSASR
ncbi:MAG: glycosyltransferase family 4 protein [Desulfovibrionaceae bacterium]|nr:glycosyltransferase family 4 protein [Desulfovibrionaceae bacterium]